VPGVVDDPPPRVEAGALVPVQIVNERKRVVRPRRGGARKNPVRALQQRINGSELGRESLVVGGALPSPLLFSCVSTHGRAEHGISAVLLFHSALAQGCKA
jgi:hypothetical protein